VRGQVDGGARLEGFVRPCEMGRGGRSCIPSAIAYYHQASVTDVSSAQLVKNIHPQEVTSEMPHHRGCRGVGHNPCFSPNSDLSAPTTQLASALALLSLPSSSSHAHQARTNVRPLPFSFALGQIQLHTLEEVSE